MTRFCCPKCGSFMFGSSNCTGPGPMIRHCYGNELVRCDFTFPDTDDRLYFHDDAALDTSDNTIASNTSDASAPDTVNHPAP